MKIKISIVSICIFLCSCCTTRLHQSGYLKIHIPSEKCDSILMVEKYDSVRQCSRKFALVNIAFMDDYLPEGDSLIITCYDAIETDLTVIPNYGYKEENVHFDINGKNNPGFFIQYKNRIFNIPYFPKYGFMEIRFIDKRRRILFVEYGCKKNNPRFSES
jgi:hypothetical protein